MQIFVKMHFWRLHDAFLHRLFHTTIVLRLCKHIHYIFLMADALLLYWSGYINAQHLTDESRLAFKNVGIKGSHGYLCAIGKIEAA